jgi:hypothetical protein
VCETWSVTLREEHKLRVFKNRVGRKTFGHVSEDVSGDWRKLHREELHDLYCSPDIIWVTRSRMMRWVGHVAHMEEKRNAYRVLVGNLKERGYVGDLCVK